MVRINAAEKCILELHRWLAVPAHMLPGFRPWLRHWFDRTCLLQTQCGGSRRLDEEIPSQQQARGITLPPAASFLRPIGLKLKKSASLLEWLNKRLAEQGDIFIDLAPCPLELAHPYRLLGLRQEP